MAILLKTTSVRVSSIQIMLVRLQNKGKSVWKSRYDGDVSAARTAARALSAFAAAVAAAAAAISAVAAALSAAADALSVEASTLNADAAALSA